MNQSWAPLLQFFAFLALAALISIFACVVAANAPRRTRYTTTRHKERRRHG